MAMGFITEACFKKLSQKIEGDTYLTLFLNTFNLSIESQYE